MNRGFVKLWRKTIDSRVFQNEGLLKVWIWCLLKANHRSAWVSLKTGRGQVEVKLSPGQFIFGRDSASKELLMKPSTVWARIKKIESIGKINIESNSQYSIITIVNWDSYQAVEKENDSENNSQMTGKQQPNDTNKNYKNKIEYPIWLDLVLWSEFKKMRTKIKSPLTDHAEKRLISKLKDLIDHGNDQRAVLNRSIENSWKGLFPANGNGSQPAEQQPAEPREFDFENQYKNE